MELVWLKINIVFSFGIPLQNVLESWTRKLKCYKISVENCNFLFQVGNEKTKKPRMRSLLSKPKSIQRIEFFWLRKKIGFCLCWMSWMSLSQTLSHKTQMKIVLLSFFVWKKKWFTFLLFYIYKRLRPSKKIRNRKKKEQQKLFNFY